MFGSTHAYEQALEFSSRITDGHLYDAMKIGTSKVEPNVVWHSKGS